MKPEWSPDHLTAIEIGRDSRIRTDGILLPKQALYQAELHPVIEIDRLRGIRTLEEIGVIRTDAIPLGFVNLFPPTY
jgi:hypothetical protein